MKGPLPREHGTERGYYQHRRRDDLPACPPCIEARRLAQIAYRDTTQPSPTERRSQTARYRALARLRDLHYAEYTALVAEEKRARHG